MNAPIPKAPPAGVIRMTQSLRRGLAGAERKLVPGHIALLETVSSRWVGDALAAVTRLEVIESLSDGPRDVDEVAAECGVDAGCLYRLLRALAREGWLTEDGRRFGLTGLTRPLLRDDPHSLRNMVLETTGPRTAGLWGRLDRAVKTGASVFGEVYPGQTLWDVLDADPAQHALFHGAMRELTRDSAPAFARAMDWGSEGTLVDLGGGTGQLLGTILALHPGLRGVLVDSASVVAQAGPVLSGLGVTDRSEVVAGDVTAEIPSGHEVYVAKHILHGSQDDGAVAMLERWAAAIPAGSRLVLIEMVVPESGPYMAFLDIQMMVGSGGKERTRAEFDDVLSRAGFRLTKVVPTATPFSLVVAERAEA